MSTTNQLSEYNLKYFKEKLQPEVFISFQRKNNEFLKGKVVSVDFENLKFTVNNDIENKPEFNTTLPISNQLRVMFNGQKHDFREITNTQQLEKYYGISKAEFKDDLIHMCSKNSCMSSVLTAEKMVENENGIKELKSYPVRLKIINDAENGGKRLKQVVGYSREQFLENYIGQSTLGITVTPEMKKDLIEKGNIGILEVSNKFDGEVKPKFIGFDNELNIPIPISIEKIKRDLSYSFKEKEINTLLKGGTATTKTGKTVKIDTVSYLTKGNIVKAISVSQKEEQSQKKKTRLKVKA